MERLLFERRKYGQELLIDACNETELAIAADTLQTAFYTVIFLREGQGTYWLDTERIALHERMLIFVRPGQISQVGEAVFSRCHFLFFEGDFLDDFFHDQNFIYKFGFFHNPELPGHLTLAPELFDRYDGLAGEIRREIQHLDSDSEHILRSIIYYLLVRLNQAYAQAYGGARQTLPDPRVVAFLRLADRGVREQISVSDCAEALGISRVYLNQLCRRYFAKTAVQVLRERVMAEIRKEIKYSGKDFAEIAYDFSFSAPSHFSRFVRQMTGLSPQGYRDLLAQS
ncbi:MAG: hypothetical protein OHK0039_03010 [Bacteroidia bacterium]